MRQYTVPDIPHSVWQKPSHFIAFGFGAGALPFAPGTFGTLIAIPFYLTLQSLSVTTYLLILSSLVIGSIALCQKVSQEIHIEDHQGMCLDEIIGYLVTLINAPRGFIWMALGFLFFRLFDIWKPWPIRWVDHTIHGGLGMILDDVLAGIVSFILLQLLAGFVL